MAQGEPREKKEIRRPDWPAALSLAAAAAYLDYDSPKPIEALLKAQEIRAVQLTPNGERRIPRSELDALLTRRLQQI